MGVGLFGVSGGGSAYSYGWIHWAAEMFGFTYAERRVQLQWVLNLVPGVGHLVYCVYGEYKVVLLIPFRERKMFG